ncbi:MAG: hypothetical protein LBU04_08130, partial [Christensenellaceae bacterium]|nr:hypothetical protein [Christensenellaceae bacterium]
NPQVTYNDSTGAITLTDENGNEQTIELPKDENGNTEFPVTIVDGGGDTYTVTKDDNGNVKVEKLENKSNEENKPPQVSNKPYYSIEGNKFYNGETIYLPLSNKNYNIEAYKDSVTKFSSGSVWSSNVEVVDSATASYTPNTISESISGSVLSTRNNNDTLQCRIVVVNVEFEEDINQRWGFDENNPEIENDYPSFRTSPFHGIKWKSLKSGGTPDNILVTVLPDGAERCVTFVVSDPNFIVNSFTKIINNKHRLSVSATNAKESQLTAQIGRFINDTMQIKLCGITEKTQKVRVFIVHEENDDVQVIPYLTTAASDTTIVISSGNNKFLDSRAGIHIMGDDRIVYNAATGDSVVIAGENKMCESWANCLDIRTTLIDENRLQDTLNKYYGQSVYKWEVIMPIEERTVNFDLNKDGKIDVNEWMTNEMNFIYDSCVKNEDKFSIIVVDNSNDGSAGMSAYSDENPQKLAFVHPNDSRNIYMTICHELGHGVFKLMHPFEEFAGFPKGGKDIFNIMNYGNRRNKFRKYQWDEINK